MFGVCLEPLSMIVEYMPHGGLDTLIADESFQFNWQMRAKILLDIARGMNHLHSLVFPSLIHRDLKPANVLVHGLSLQFPLSEFGSNLVVPGAVDLFDTIPDLDGSLCRHCCSKGWGLWL